MSEGEKKAVALGPKFTTYETITKHKIDVAAEELVTKLRWESRSREEREGEWTEEWEWDQVKQKIVFDEPNGTMNYSKQRVTDLPTNRRTTIPPPGKVKEKIVYANMKSRIDTVRENYVKKKCDDKGNIKASNIDTKTKQGIRSLQDRAKKGELLVVPSDKSGKLCVNSVENYVAAMEPHIKNDPVITLSDKNTTERVLNGTTLQLGRILRMGENHNHWDRTKQALTNKKGHVPVLSGMEKDHKQVEEGQQVPLRPCAGADEANNGQLSHTLAQIVAATAEIVDKEVKSMCKSTDELIHGIEEEVNKQPNIKDLIIFSSDISPQCFPVSTLQNVLRWRLMSS